MDFYSSDLALKALWRPSAIVRRVASRIRCFVASVFLRPVIFSKKLAGLGFPFRASD